VGKKNVKEIEDKEVIFTTGLQIEMISILVGTGCIENHDGHHP
jgi:hypothetical protein